MRASYKEIDRLTGNGSSLFHFKLENDLLDGTSTVINTLAAVIDGNGKAASEEVGSFQRGSYYMTPVDCMSNLDGAGISSFASSSLEGHHKS